MAGHSAQGVVRVSRKPKTASETEIVRLITATNESTPIGNFSQLVKDLAAAGIVISGNQVAIKGDKVTIYNKDEVALFAQDGKLNASLIDADTITVNHLYARNTNGSVVGHFGNADKKDAQVGSSDCPLWVGATVASNAPFRVSSDGSLYSVRGSIGGFKIAEDGIGTKITTEDSPGSMYLSKNGITFLYSSSENGRSHVTATTYSGITEPLLDIYSYEGRIFEGLQVRIHGRAAVASDAKYGIEADITEGGDNFPYGYDDQFLGDNSVVQTRHYALYAQRGNISADEGWIGGAKYNKLSLTATYTELDMRKNNVWIVANNSNTSERRLVLPSRLIVNQAIGRTDKNSTNPFCVKVFIVVHRSSRYGFHVNARGISSYYNNENYPYMYDSNGTKFSEHDMSPGDSAEFLLIYDGTEYYAQLTQINK